MNSVHSPSGFHSVLHLKSYSVDSKVSDFDSDVDLRSRM